MRSTAALMLLSACSVPGQKTPDEVTLTCSAEVDPEVSTLINVTWEAPEGSTSWVEFSANLEESQATNPVEDTDVALELIGLPASTSVAWTAISERDGERWTCEGTTTTGALPEGISDWTVSVAAEDPTEFPRFMLVVLNGDDGVSRIIGVDRLGRIVWYAPEDTSGVTVQARLTLDGTAVTYNLFGRLDDNAESYLKTISMGGDLLDQAITPGAHHMFTELPGRIYAYQSTEIRDYPNPTTGEVEPWVGDTVMEINADHEVRAVFNLWDWQDPEESDRTYDGDGTVTAADWSHGNGLRYDPDTDTYLLSLGNLGEIIEIARSNGTPTRIFGNHGYEVEGGDPIYFQHDPRLLDNGNLTMFRTDQTTAMVGAYEYAVDDANQTLTPVWVYSPQIQSEFLGQVRRLDNGNTWVNFGEGGVVREVSSSGETLWEVTPPEGMTLAQVQCLYNFYGSP